MNTDTATGTRDILQRAIACHEAGELDRAESIYRELLRVDSSHPDALHLLGVAAHQRGQNGEAIDLISRAIAAGGRSALACSNLGASYRNLGETARAVESFRDAIDIDPQFAGAHFNLAMALAAEGCHAEAIFAFQDAVRVDSHFVDAHHNLATTLARVGRYEEAVDSFRAAVEIAPHRADILYNLGSALSAAGKVAEGVEHFRAATRLNPANADLLCALATSLRQNGLHREAAEQYTKALLIDPRADAHFGLGFVFLSEGRPAEARERFEQALWVDPNHGPSLTHLGSLLLADGQIDEAIGCFEQAVRVQPGNAAAHYNLGNALKDGGRLGQARTRYERALAINPRLTEAHINLGVVLERQGELDTAIACHTRALDLRPGDAEARFHRAAALLAAGRLAEGWEDYESRWDYEGKARTFLQPAWDGAPLEGRSLLAYAEQGVGDEIMFASCLTDLIGQTRDCVVECDPRLVPLFARSFPLARVFARPIDARIAERTDLHVAFGSLPRHLRPTLDHFPRVHRYLTPDPQRLEDFRSRLAALGTGLKVGISWRGGGKPDVQRRRSTQLREWASILSVPNVHFVNLQYGSSRDEIQNVATELGLNVHHFDDVDPLADLDGFAAEIAALDLVISADNATVHMAGALGVPVWTLLPSAPNWRWMQGREDSCWYPAMRLFRQTVDGEWTAVQKRVAEALAGLAAESFIQSSAVEASPDEHIRQEAGGIRPTQTTAEHAAPHSDADHERRKYEHIWTHDAYRRVSPGLLDADKVGLVDKLRTFGVRTVLDAGCGSGKLMKKLMVEHATEFDVHGFDISTNCLDPFFDPIKDEILTVGCLWNAEDFRTLYDAVICTDVMEHIPTRHVDRVLANFHQCTRKVCYLAIALFPDRFGPQLLGEPLHLTVQPPNWWYARIALAGFQIAAHGVEKNAAGQDMWLHAFMTP